MGEGTEGGDSLEGINRGQRVRGALGGHCNKGWGGGEGLRERENLDETLHARN
jgi:hypothetical protein